MKHYISNFLRANTKIQNFRSRSVSITIAFALLLGIVIPSIQTPKKVSAYNGYLRRQGMNIVDASGNRIKLNGFNLGNWLLWEQWMMGTSLNANGQTYMQQNLVSLVGETRAKQFESDVHANYYTATDFQRIADEGFNVVRLPINYRILEDDANPGVYKDYGWQLLDNAVNWAEQAGIYVVFDMHSVPGAHSPYFPAAPATNTAQLWTSTVFQNRTSNIWKAIADRYKSRQAVAAYDLLNESVPPNNNALTTYYQQLIQTIRTVDQNHMIMLEGASYAKDNSIFATRYDENMAVSIHQYMWGTIWPEYDVASAVDQAKRLNVPIWVGEFGLDHNHVIAGRVNRYTNDPLISGYAGWAWKASVTTGVQAYWQNPNTFTTTAPWQKTVGWMSDTSKPKPTVAEAEQGMQDYISIISAPPTINQATLNAYKAPSVGTGTGLGATYFGDANLTTQRLTRTDPTINFNWGWGSPAGNIPGDNFSARWTGFIQPQYNETYTFTTTADDRVRVWINGTLVIDDWVINGIHSKSGSIALQAGQKYSIKVEYVESTWGAEIKLQWASPTTSQAVVPTSQLYTN